MLLGERLRPGSQNATRLWLLQGALDLARLRDAFREVVREFPVLSTTFEEHDGEWVSVAGNGPIAIEHHVLGESRPQRDAMRLAQELAERPFELHAPPLLRAAVIEHSPREAWLLLVAHHALVDGPSLGILLDAWAAAYQGERSSRSRPAFSEYVAWERSLLESARGAELGEYWAERLRGVELEPPGWSGEPLGADASREAAAEVVRMTLSSERLRALHALSGELGVTPFAALLGLFQLALHRFSGLDEIVVAVVSSTRVEARWLDVVGPFINLVPVRSRFEPDAQFGGWARSLAVRVLEALRHQPWPARGRTVSASSWAGSHAVLNYTKQRTAGLRLAELEVAPEELDIARAYHPLVLEVEEWPGAAWARLSYDPAQTSRAVARALLAAVFDGLDALARDRDARLGAISLLAADERAALASYNPRPSPFEPATVLQQFRRQVARSPRGVALEYGRRELSYAELAQYASAMGARLRELGVAPRQVVALCCRRSPEMVAALLGILECGAAYMPLDPSAPRDRQRLLLGDSGAVAVVLDAPHRAELESVGLPCLVAALEPGESSPLEPPLPGAADPVYRLYTSGSTGTPKAVTVTHGNLTAFLHGMDQLLEPPVEASAQPVLLATSRLTFDIAVVELLWTLARGFRVVLSAEAELGAGSTRPSLLERPANAPAMSHLQCTPSLLALMLEDAELSVQLAEVRQLLVGGEVLRPELLEPIARQLPHAQLFNMYGPTETTVWVTAHRVPRDHVGEVPIGRPLANVRVHVVDAQGEPLPPGVPGELCVAGPFVAAGYWRRDDLSAAKFVPDRFHPERGESMYRTGDRAYWRDDGELCFLGRRDDQVKIRGHRVELGEIEGTLARHPGLRQAAVVVVPEPAPQLVAYYSADRRTALGEPPSPVELRDFLARSLPGHLIPARWVSLDQLPLTASGKVDRRALVQRGAEPDVGEPPRTAVERAIAAIWSELLGREVVSRSATFFELGGDSLVALRAANRIERACGVSPSVRDLLAAQSLEALARLVELRGGAAIVAARPALPEASAPALSSAQEQLWFVSRLPMSGALYNENVVVRLGGALDVVRLVAAIRGTVEQHAVLRTLYDAVDGNPVPRLASADAVEVLVHEVAASDALPVSDRIRALATRPFALDREAPIRFALYRAAADDHLLQVVAHHIAWDAWSGDVLAAELAQRYAATVAGGALSAAGGSGANRGSLRAPSYFDFVARQRAALSAPAHAAGIAYWQAELSPPARLDLPTVRSTAAIPAYRGESAEWALGPALSARLESLAEQRGVTPFMLLLAAFQALLHRCSGQDDIRVGTPVSTRAAEDEATIGCFVNVVVVRSQLEAGWSFDELLEHVRQRTLGAFEHADVPFAHVVEAINPARSAAGSPLFQAMLVMQNAPLRRLALGDIAVTRVRTVPDTARFELTLVVEPGEAGFDCLLNCDADLFPAGSARRFAAQLEMLLRAALQDPSRPIAELPLGAAPMPAEQPIVEPLPSIVQRIEHQRGARPGAIALVDAEGECSYAALRELSRRAAAALGSRQMVPRPVAILAGASRHAVCAALAALEAGCCFAFFEPSTPLPRLRHSLADLGQPSLLVADEVLRDSPNLRADLGVDGAIVTPLSELFSASASASAWAARRAVAGHDSMYVVYTSGSTGAPKGIEQSDRSFSQFLEWQADAFAIGPGTRVAVWSPLSYDAGLCELFGALCFGATACLPREEQRLSPARLVEWLVEARIDLLQTVPSFLRPLTSALIASERHGNPHQLSTLLLSGEVLSPSLASGWLEAFGARTRLYNLYGPSESVLATWYPVETVDDDARFVPVGAPIAGRRVIVRDAAGAPVPPGVVGEIVILSRFLTKGYRGLPDDTARAFIELSDVSGETLQAYRTGDLGRWGADGSLEFCGRRDGLVKVRGNRVEVGDIEDAIAHQPGVAECAVGVQLVGGEAVLVAHVAGEDIEPAELRRELSKGLPSYMLPSRIVVLERLPRTRTNKIDRRALPEPAPLPARAEEAPMSELERTIVTVWREVLKNDTVGPDDNFFEAGGHSLTLAAAHARLESLLGRSVPLLELLQRGSARAIAHYLNGSSPSPTERPRAIENRARALSGLRQRRAATRSKG